LKIVQLKIPGIRQRLAEQMVDAVHGIRLLDLKKKPCVSETLDWAQALLALQVEDLSGEIVLQSLNVVCKYRSDAELVEANMEKIIKN
jgi:hypothetical protein